MEQRSDANLVLVPELVAQAQGVFTGKVLALGPAPGFVSGESPAYQTVKLSVERVLKGELLSGKDISVEVLILQGKPFVGYDENQIPALDSASFRVGARFLVYAQKTPSGWRVLSEDRALKSLDR